MLTRRLYAQLSARHIAGYPWNLTILQTIPICLTVPCTCARARYLVPFPTFHLGVWREAKGAKGRTEPARRRTVSDSTVKQYAHTHRGDVANSLKPPKLLLNLHELHKLQYPKIASPRAALVGMILITDNNISIDIIEKLEKVEDRLSCTICIIIVISVIYCILISIFKI